MPQTSDDARTDELPDVLLGAPLGRCWMVPGGEEDDASVTLHVIVSDRDGTRTKRYDVRLPLAAVGLDLVVGVPEVTGR